MSTKKSIIIFLIIVAIILIVPSAFIYDGYADKSLALVAIVMYCSVSILTILYILYRCSGMKF